MSTDTQSSVEQSEHHGENENYLNHETGLWSWLTTKDHKRIGILYCLSLAVVFLVAGVLAIFMRLELSGPGETIMSNDTYNQVFTMHGIMMVFLFLVPSVPAILGNFVLPIQLGAKDVAFPRLNLASYYVYLAGGLLVMAALIVGKVDTGWTFYTPYSSSPQNDAVIFMTMAIFIAGFASIFTGINFIVTIHKMRAPGMTWNRLPLFVWGLYATSIVQVLATPGHTPESVSYRLGEEALFTGDTLFLRAVGRPDLDTDGEAARELVSVGDPITFASDVEELAGDRIAGLPRSTRVAA